MRHHQFSSSPNAPTPIALLLKSTAFKFGDVVGHYVDPLVSRGLSRNDLIAFTLEYPSGSKVTNAQAKTYLDELLPILKDGGVTTLYVADSNYFKVLTKQTKAEPHLGYVLPCKLPGFEFMNVVLGLNHQQLFYNPELQKKLDLSLTTLAAQHQGTYQALGGDIIHSASYPENLGAIKHALAKLHEHPKLTCDIEAFSLKFNEAGIGSIAFAWDQHNGVAFTVDWQDSQEWVKAHPTTHPIDALLMDPGIRVDSPAVRAELKKFFTEYQGEITWHNGTGYDIKVLITTLWMKDLGDTAGLLEGLEILTRNIHDTKIIAYLATNTTAGNVLGLKPLAHEFAGNWAVEEIKDIRKLPRDKLLQYNLVDALSTAYVRDKYHPKMIADQQEALYTELMLPSAKMLIQTELTGMPLSRSRVQEVKLKLMEIQQAQLWTIQQSPVIQMLNLLLQESAWEDDFAKRVAKAKNPQKIQPKAKTAFSDRNFNPNSGPQLQRLLYELMGLPVIDFTDTKQPATGAETLAKLINHTQEPGYKAILEALIIYGGVTKILSTFITAFEEAVSRDNNTSDIVWLHGNFNLGGTVSGRLSSSDPNLTNIPAKAKVKIGDTEIDLGKLVKYCFVSPPGMIFCGSDFNSLEDYISALTTKDPNKLKVYEQGFDGHCLRAAYYYEDQLPHVDRTDPASVNLLKKTHEDLRQESKTPTFALTYQGTYHTLMANLGWSEEKAKRIEAAYHDMYQVSDQYVQDKLKQASKDGYVTVAFGLRLRTPLLSQVIFNGAKMPYEAAAEGRTAGNALGQSYCMLTMRAAVDFMKKVWASPYRLRIRCVALIHDAIYLLVDDDEEVLLWVNRELIASMRWQELPEIQHPTVKLGAALDLFWPDWAHPITIDNDVDLAALRAVCRSAKDKATA